MTNATINAANHAAALRETEPPEEPLTELGAAAPTTAESDADLAKAWDRHGRLVVLGDVVAAYLAGHAGASVGDVVRHVHELCPARPGLHNQILRAIDSQIRRHD